MHGQYHVEFSLSMKLGFGQNYVELVRGKTLVAFDLRALPPEADRAGAGARKQQSYREIGRVWTKVGHGRWRKGKGDKCNCCSRLTLMEDQFYQQRVARHGL